ncbi:MAG TPA: type II toxin-antitoxin system HigB family toxin [Xanthobacteraceae bacterium]|jgi:hypothetical protein
MLTEDDGTILVSFAIQQPLDAEDIESLTPLIADFDFRRQIAFVKYIGTHAEYDRIDALTVSQF